MWCRGFFWGNRQFWALQCIRWRARQKPIFCSMAYFTCSQRGVEAYSELCTIPATSKEALLLPAMKIKLYPEEVALLASMLLHLPCHLFFPAASLHGTQNHSLSLSDFSYFTISKSHPDVLISANLQKTWGIQKTWGNPQKTIPMIPTYPHYPCTHGLRALHQRFRLHLRIGR